MRKTDWTIGFNIAGCKIGHFYVPAPEHRTFTEEFISSGTCGPVVTGAKSEWSFSQRGAVQSSQMYYPASNWPAQIKRI